MAQLLRRETSCIERKWFTDLGSIPSQCEIMNIPVSYHEMNTISNV